jgi:hypothetical protein
MTTNASLWRTMVKHICNADSRPFDVTRWIAWHDCSTIASPDALDGQGDTGCHGSCTNTARKVVPVVDVPRLCT